MNLFFFMAETRETFKNRKGNQLDYTMGIE